MNEVIFSLYKIKLEYIDVKKLIYFEGKYIYFLLEMPD